MTYGHMSSFVISSGADATGRDCWTWQLVSRGEENTCFVMIYNPCKPGKDSKGYTVCEQHQHYFEAKGGFHSPWTISCEQLVTQF